MKKLLSSFLCFALLVGSLGYSERAEAITCTANPIIVMQEWFCKSNLNSPTYNAWFWFEFPTQYIYTTPQTLTNVNVTCAWGYSGTFQPLVRATRASDGEYVWGNPVFLSCVDDGII